jgi:hypothetical protein
MRQVRPPTHLAGCVELFCGLVTLSLDGGEDRGTWRSMACPSCLVVCTYGVHRYVFFSFFGSESSNSCVYEWAWWWGGDVSPDLEPNTNDQLPRPHIRVKREGECTYIHSHTCAYTNDMRMHRCTHMSEPCGNLECKPSRMIRGLFIWSCCI